MFFRHGEIDRMGRSSNGNLETRLLSLGSMGFSVLKRGTGYRSAEAAGKVLGTGETEFHGNCRYAPVRVRQIPLGHFHALIELVLLGRNARRAGKMTAQLSVAEPQSGEAILQGHIHTQRLIDLLLHPFTPDLR